MLSINRRMILPTQCGKHNLHPARPWLLLVVEYWARVTLTTAGKMSGSIHVAGANVLLLRKAEDKRQRDALRRAFKVGICQSVNIYLFWDVFSESRC